MLCTRRPDCRVPAVFLVALWAGACGSRSMVDIAEERDTELVTLSDVRREGLTAGDQRADREASGDGLPICDLVELLDWHAGDVPVGPCDPPLEPAISGLIYLDGDQSSDSYHAQGLYPAHDAPLPGIGVSLIDELGTTWSGLTCGDGRFSFGGLEDGYYLLAVDMPPAATCTSANRAVRLPAAVAGGEVVVVTLGDSIPVSGGQPPFPDILADYLGHLALVDNRNVAAPGSHTAQWLPGAGHFETKALPELPAADVVIVSLGGNDLNSLLPMGGGLDIEELLTALEELPGKVQEIIDNIEVVLAAVREAAPEADIIYCIYLNYANSDLWKGYAGQYSGLIVSGMSNLLSTMREQISDVPGIIIADVYGAVDPAPIDQYLADAVHLSSDGHLLYAREIFMALGGARVGESPLGLERSLGFFIE